MIVELRGTIVTLFESKKFVAGLTSSLTAILVQFAGKFGWLWLDPATANHISGIIVLLATVYLGAQGAADHGKEAAAEVAMGPEVPTPLVVPADHPVLLAMQAQIKELHERLATAQADKAAAEERSRLSG